MTANTSTITVEIIVSRRDGQVTFAVSALTCWRKIKGFVVFDAICRSVFKTRWPGLLDDPAGRDVPPGLHVGAESARTISPMQIGRVKPASQLHASRVCFVYIKPIPDPRKWQVSALWPNAASEPSSRPVPAMSALCPNRANMASLPPIFKCGGHARRSNKTRTSNLAILGNGTGSRARTYDLRFWRPPLYQLSYARTCAFRRRRFLKASGRSVKSGRTRFHILCRKSG